MHSKKGQGLSMNVIIIAAIALLVLVILSVLVLRTGREVVDAKQCLAVDRAQCADVTAGCPTGTIHHRSLDDTCSEGEQCCIPLGGE